MRWRDHAIVAFDTETTGLSPFTGDRIIDRPPIPQWIHKRIMREALDSSLENTMVMTSNASGIMQGSTDAVEARRAFAEKRRPKFTAG